MTMHENEYELYHYGVLGMKWGVRKNAQKAYEKASKKLTKLNESIDKSEAKLIRRRRRYDNAMTSRFASQRVVNKNARKYRKEANRHARAMKKADRWLKSMEKTFAKTDIKLSEEQKKLGKRYADYYLNRALRY